MLLQSQLSSPLTPGSPRTTHVQLWPLTARPAQRRLVGSVSGHRQPRPVHTKTRPDPSLTPSPERPEDMPPSRPCLRLLCPHLVLLLSLLLLAGLAGCGPASSDNAPGVKSGASVSKPPLSADGTGLETWAQSAPPGAVDPLIQAQLLEEEESQDLDEEEENQNLENLDEEGEQPAVQNSKEVQEVQHDKQDRDRP